jgi:hypothetical protein
VKDTAFSILLIPFRLLREAESYPSQSATAKPLNFSDCYTRDVLPAIRKAEPKCAEEEPKEYTLQ